MRYRFILTLVCLCAWWPSVLVGRDSLQISLLTCAPGQQVYELFGHTAIRCRNFTKGTDLVYNYGVFDFDTPNFVMRFVRGETDYELGVVPFRYFEREYALRGSSVKEQVLKLNDEEMHFLDSLLRDNYLPENRVYRYNYFYDNCTSRARDRIEDALQGRVVYPPGVKNATFRSWVHQYTKNHPWTDFGISLCLGAEADRPIDGRSQMFLPDNLRQAMNHATVHGGGGDSAIRKLVKSETEILPSMQEGVEEGASFPLTPMQSALAVLALVVVCSLWEWKRRRVWWGIDVCLFFLQGVAGCVVAFLFFFSVHPTVGSNYLLLLLNPLPLIALPWMVFCVRRGKKCPYDVANVAILTLFILFFPLIPQKISLVVVSLALNLLVRSVLHLAVARVKGGIVANK